MELNLTIIIFGLCILFLIYLSGWFSSTETALTNLSLIDIVNLDRKDKRTKFIIKLKENLDLSLVSILIMNNIVNVLLSVIPVIFLSLLFKDMNVGFLIVLITLIIILFGDIIPKSRAINNKHKIIFKNARIMYYIFVIIKPLVLVLIYFSKLINKNLGDKSKKLLLVDEKTIREITNISHKLGNIKKIEKDLISNTLLFGDLKVKEVMLKKKDVFFLSKNHSIKKARSIVSEKPFTRIPFLSKNKISGVLYAKDLLKSNVKSISKIIRKPYVVNENEDISVIFKKMKSKRVHLAIVSNSLDKFKGIITLEDIVETIVGDIEDEYFSQKNKK